MWRTKLVDGPGVVVMVALLGCAGSQSNFAYQVQVILCYQRKFRGRNFRVTDF